MQVFINKVPYELDSGATLLDAIRAIDARPPFAAAINTQFVPSARYGEQALHSQDQIDIISPVTGG